MRKPLEQRIGRKVMAYEVITRQSDNTYIGTRGQQLGVIESVTDKAVGIFYKNNPLKYQHFNIARSDFDKWLSQGLYVIK